MDVTAVLENLRKNGISPEKSYFECPDCEDRGYTVTRSATGELMTRSCPCQIRKDNQRRIERSGLAGLLESCTLETYQTAETWQKQAGGNPGSGKTHLCTAICGKLMEAGLPVWYMQWRADIPSIKAKVNDAELYEDAVGKLKTIRVLYIDDFLKGNVTEADRNIAFEILNARYIKPECATIISSERTIGQILDWDEAIGSRIAERSKGFTMSVTGSGKNWRLR